MASITSWMRLEPRSRNAEMKTSLQAAVYDPLWLLARQWQMGEFQGEDNGSPVIARWRADAAPLTRYRSGMPVQGNGGIPISYDVRRMPLETHVERETVRPAGEQPGRPAKLRLAAEAGEHFLRLLAAQPVSKDYDGVFVGQFAFLPLSDDDRQALDASSLAYLDLVGPRVPDGRRLYAAFRPAPGAAIKLPPGLAILPADIAEVEKAAAAWFPWYESLFSEPAAGDSPWLPERLEYAFSVGARLSDGEQVLSAREYADGRLDWYDFDVDPGQSLGAPGGAAAELVKTAIPAPVSFRGMAAPRFWEFEDAQVDFGSVEAGPTDLVRMLLVEFALAYGNDWFVIPVDLDIGTVCRTRSLIITDTFGVRTLIPPANDTTAAASDWRMFQNSQIRSSQPLVPVANLFFLPPSLVQDIESRPVEEVLFLRDEMANLAWGVERLVESACEQPLNRYEAYLEQERRKGQTSAAEPPPPGTVRYRLMNEVPDYWVPLMPVRTPGGLRLRRGAVLKMDGTQGRIEAQGRILEPGKPLALFDEEVPRAGIRVTRTYQFTRWTDGSSHLWIGRTKGVGRGEGSSGLRYDSLVETS